MCGLSVLGGSGKAIGLVRLCAEISGGTGGAIISTISNGTLAVDFYEPTSRALIWRDTATQSLNPSGNQQTDRERLKGVERLFETYSLETSRNLNKGGNND